MLHENLSLINPVITTTTARVGELVTSALTGSLQNILIAAVDVASNPLSPASYAGLLTSGVASGQLLVGNGLKVIQSIGGGGFDIAGIALKEVKHTAADTTNPPADAAPASPHVLKAPAAPVVDSPAASGEPSGHVVPESVAKDAVAKDTSAATTSAVASSPATTSSSEDASPTTSSARKSPTTTEAVRVKPAAKAEAKTETAQGNRQGRQHRRWPQP
jgi:hypothetical protein